MLFKVALFMTEESLNINPKYQCIGREEQWQNQKQYKKLCHKGIQIAIKWLKNNVFIMRNITINGKFFKKVGWSSKSLISTYYNPIVKNDIRTIEQRLRHSVEYWYPIVLHNALTRYLNINDLVKIVISYL